MKSVRAKLVYIATALLFSLVPLLSSGSAAAANQMGARKVTLGSSASSASTTYNVSFTAATSTTIAGIVVDICDDSPLIGSTTCTLPAGFSWGATGSLTANFTNGNLPQVTNTWTAAGVQGGGASASFSQVLELSNTTAQSLVSGTTYNFTMAAVTNPSTANHSYYARVLTFDTTAHMTTEYTTSTTVRASSFADNKDYGGIAMSTGSGISLQAKVYETLTFCVFDNTASCGTAPSLNLGATGTNALDTTNTYINTKASYTLASNAANGVTVSMTGTTLCRVTPLTSANCPASTSPGPNTITALGSTATAPATNTEKFGMCIDTTGSAALTADPAYADSVSTNNCHTSITAGQQTTYSGSSRFGFDDNTSTGTNSTGGDPILTSSGAVPSVTNPFAFIADVAATTEAGLYQTNLNLVATSRF